MKNERATETKNREADQFSVT